MRWSRATAESTRGGRLEITLRGRRLSLELSGEGFVAAPVAAEHHIDRCAAEALSAEIRAILNRATRWGDADQGSRELMRQRAEVLFDTLFPASIKRALREAGGRGGRPPLACVLDRELLHLPWELLHTGHGFLGLVFSFGRVARGLLPEVPVVRVGPAQRRRALVLCDPRGDLIGSYYEGLTLRDELTQHRGWEVDLRSSEVGRADVKRLLREYDVVHFAGHAEPWPLASARDGGGDARARGWWLSDGVLAARDIRELAGGRRFPRLIFSNACRSAEGGVAPAGGSESLAASLAGAFLEAGVDHFVGTIEDVPDEPASLFALTFYGTLLAQPEGGIGGAVRAARAELAERYGPDSVYWAAWVLYGWPSGAGAAAASAVTLEGDAGSAPQASRVAATPIRPTNLPPVAARVRGAAAPATTAGLMGVAAPPVRWTSTPFWRGAAFALGVCGMIWVALTLAAVLGRAPPTGWTEGAIIERMVPPAGPPSVAPARARGGVAGLVTTASANASLVVLRDGRRTLAEARAPERFRLRVVTPESGYIALWRVDSHGRVARVDAGEREDGPLTEVVAGGILELPGDGSWWSIASEGAAERYYLAWRQVEPSDRRAFLDELSIEIGHVETALEAAERLGRAPAAALEGLPGIREGASGEEIRERLEETLEDRFDTVVRRVVGSPR